MPRPMETPFGELPLGFDKRYGIGEGSVHRVKQILRTGTCDDLAALREQFPAGLRELLEVKGLGAKTIRKIHRNLGIRC